MIRFLHLADVHLDTVFLNRDAQLRSMLREALRDTFKAGVDLGPCSRLPCYVNSRRPFDNQTLSFMTENFYFLKWSDCLRGRFRFFYATGNHDPSESRGRVSQLEVAR